MSAAGWLKFCWLLVGMVSGAWLASIGLRASSGVKVRLPLELAMAAVFALAVCWGIQ